MFYYLTDRILKESSGEYYHTIGILKSVVDEGVQVCVISNSENRKIFQSLFKTHDNIFFYYVPTAFGRLSNFNFYLSAISFLKRSFLKGDIVYSRDTVYSFMLSMLPSIIKRALVMEINGVAALESQSRLQKIIYSLLDRLKVKWLWHQTCFNLCVSEGVKFFYQNKHQYLNNLKVIHNGLNKSIMDSSEVSIKKSDDQIIVFVGNFTNWQRFDLLLKALEHNLCYLRKKRFLVHLYGTGPCFEELASSITSLDLSDIVILKGILSQSEMPEVLSGACLGLILDDRYINRIPLFSPLKYYEYNAFNLPTLYLNQFGDLNLPNCVPFDVDDFGDVLVSLEDRLSVSGVFEESPRTWDDVVKEIFEIYWRINEK